MKRFWTGMMIGLGAGMVASGIVCLFSPFRADATSFGLMGLGGGLLIGGVAAALAREPK